MRSTPPAHTGHPAAFVAWLAAERALRMVLSVVVVALVARHLSPDGFGQLNFALTLVGTVMPLAMAGLDVIVVRELVRSPERKPQLLGTATVLRLVIGAVCALALFATAQVWPPLQSAQSAIGPISLLLLAQAIETPDLWFRCQVQSRPTAVARLTAVTLGAAAKLGLIAAGAGVRAFAWVVALEGVLFGVGVWLAYRRRTRGGAPWQWDAATAAVLIRASWGFAAAGFIGGLAFRVDQIAVAVFLGDSAAGSYFAALRLIELPTFLAATIATALFPALASAQPSRSAEQLETAFGVMGAAAWMTALGVTITAPWLIRLCFGTAYHEAWPALVVHAWATLPYFSAMIRAQFLAVQGRSGTQAASGFAALVFQIIGAALLVPRFGITGAAMAFLLTQLASMWLLPIFLPSLRPTVAAQGRGWLVPLRPSAWPGFVAAFRRKATA